MNKLTAKQRDLLFRIETKPELRPFFFRKAKGLEWFDPLKEKGFFEPSQNPPPKPAKKEGYVNIPSWPITDYLVKASQELNSQENEEYAVKFLDLIRECTKYAIENNYGNYRTWWQFAEIMSNIPPHLISLDDINLFSYWIDDQYERGMVAREIGIKWIPKLLNNGDEHSANLACGLIKKLFSVIIIEHEHKTYKRKEAVFSSENHWLKETAETISTKLGEVAGLSGVKILLDQLQNLLSGLNNDKTSTIWRSAIEEHEQNHSARDAGDILIQSTRDALLGYVEANPEEALAFISSVLEESEFETLKRIIIYVISNKFDQLNSLTNKIIINDFFEDNYRHEFWHFLNNNYRKLNQAHKKKVLEIIENLTVEEDDGSIHVKATAYLKATWLSSIYKADEDLSQKYKKYVEIAGAEPDHPDFSSYMKSGWVTHESPFKAEELLALSVEELFEKINSYEDLKQFDEPGLRGLADCLQDVIKSAPQKYYKHFNKFIGSDLAYIHSLIDAYRELWVKKTHPNIEWEEIWKKLLNFCNQLINDKTFWSEENSKRRDSFVANRHWIVTIIGRLIEDGTRSDNLAFKSELMPLAKEILLTLLENQEGEEFKEDSDAVSIAINSPRGHCVEALINYSLRQCRLADKVGDGHAEAWKEVEPIFDNELDLSNKGIFEFATLVVNFLPNFQYMSIDWVKENLSNIFNQQNYLQWLCAMNGFVYVNQVHETIYKHLKENGDFLRALDDNNLKKKVTEKAIQHIVVAYVNDFEKLSDTDSLIAELLRRNNYEELSHIIWFFKTLRKEDNPKVKEKVFEIWPKLLSSINFETKEGKTLASRLCEWSSFIENIDVSNKDFLLAIAPFADEDFNAYNLLKSLARLSNSQPFEVHEIWIKMLEESAPDYPKEALVQILQNLVHQGPEGQRKAKEIVDKYIKNGNDTAVKIFGEIMHDQEGRKTP